MLRSLFVIYFLFISLPTLATDYFTTVVDVIPGKQLIDMGHKMLRCEELFKTARVRLHRTASFSMDFGVRNDDARGMQLQERDLELFDEISRTIVARTLLEYRKSGHHTESELNKIFMFHQTLNPQRLKITSTESVENGHFPQFTYDGHSSGKFNTTVGQLFSSLRIYDSSPVPKFYSRRHSLPKVNDYDTQELAERIFKGFNLEQALGERGIQRSPHTWSLGLGNVTGNQDSALLTLFAQTADLLDLHYNKRSYLNFKNTDEIAKDDVDIVFYANEALTPYYIQTLGLNPLQRADGQPLTFEKRGNRFYIFHIKGSAFIQKYLDLRFHQPLYGNSNGLKNEWDVWQFFLKGLQEHYEQASQSQLNIKTIDDFLSALEPILMDYFKAFQQNSQPSEDVFFSTLARFIQVRNSLPDNIFDLTYSEATKERVRDLIYRTTGAKSVEEQLLYVGFMDFLLRDPIQFLMNRTHSTR